MKIGARGVPMMCISRRVGSISLFSIHTTVVYLYICVVVFVVVVVVVVVVVFFVGIQPLTFLNSADSTKWATCMTVPSTGCFQIVLTASGSFATQSIVSQISSNYYDAFVFGGTTSGTPDAAVFLAIGGPTAAIFSRNSGAPVLLSLTSAFDIYSCSFQRL
jgi:hypothetical protein